jgi:1,4-dihydroxy-6-naphthoate synthase
MFWAIASRRIDPRAYGFRRVAFRTADTETLNRWAETGAVDVCAVSIAHVPALRPEWMLLPHGGSLGRGYGPVVVAARRLDAAALAGRRVGIPGERTTAARLLRRAAPAAIPVVVPFADSFHAIDRAAVDAAVLIHEGRLVYERLGYHLVVDLGEHWTRTTGLPIPLGGNVIRRALGEAAIAAASAMCRASIAYALAHRDEAIDELLPSRPSPGPAMSRADADTYLSLYANADTLDYGADGRVAIERLLECGVDWAP